VPGATLVRLAVLEWPNIDALSISVLPVAAFAAIVIGEIVSPRRSIDANPLPRWLGNTGLFLINSVAIFILAPTGGVILDRLGLRADFFGAGRERGLWLWTTISQIEGIVLLDLLLYLLHRLYHRVPFLWRFHAVHHADTVVDATTAIRHHPGEYLASYAILAVVAAVLGLSQIAVGAYGLVLLMLQMTQHANIRFPQQLDRVLRCVLVTPDVHRIHHAVTLAEGNSNFGAALSIWDRLWRTYLEPTASRNGNTEFGVSGMNDSRYQRLRWMLLTPAMVPNGPVAPPRQT
jgi:sterol desaturase/sphingolipid hydroxylase (fatty acid hydroxylase superfamily)